MNWLFRKKKEDFFLVLDIGTKAVKSLFCFKDKSDLYILSSSSKNFSEYKSKKAVESVKTAVFDSFKNGVKNISFSLADKNIKNSASKIRKWDTVLTFSPDIFKARMAVKKITREKQLKKILPGEEKKIIEKAIIEAKKEISADFLKSSGIVSGDIYFISSYPFEYRIDGYPVSKISGFEGKEIEIKVMFTFMPLSYLRALMEVVSVLKKDINICLVTHLAEGLLASKPKSGLYIDVGGMATQYIRVKNGQLVGISEFTSGGSSFSESLSDDLGISMDMAENMQEQYSSKLLSKETSAKVKEIFSVPKNNWYNKLIKDLNKKSGNVFSPYVYLFGGASAMQEIQDVFKEYAESSEKDLHISGVPETSLYLLEDIKDTTKKINKPQWTPAALIANKYAKENI
jgi:cell division ATPase FtsA